MLKICVPSQLTRLACFHLPRVSMRKRTKNPYCTRLAWQMAEISQAPVCPKNVSILGSWLGGRGAWGRSWGGQLSGVWIREGAGTQQGRANLDICALYIVHHWKQPSCFIYAVHCIHCALLSIGSWHCTALQCEFTGYNQVIHAATKPAFSVHLH